MSEEESEHLESKADPNTRLILYRLGKMEESFRDYCGGEQKTHAEIFKRLRSLENWRTYMLGAGAVVTLLLWGLWDWVMKRGF